MFRLTFLGTSTSVGVPMIGCDCPTCRSADPRDRRLRSSVFIETDDRAWIVDCGPDLRAQCLRAGITELDALLITHTHTDHVVGFDELRRFTLGADASLPVHARPSALERLGQMFPYVFDGENNYPGYFKPDPVPVTGPFALGKTSVTPVPVLHGKVETIGYRFDFEGGESLAYVPDCKTMTPEGRAILNGCDTLILDALRFTEHPTHMNFEEALALVAEIDPPVTYFTHFTCQVRHAEAEKQLPERVFLAYDGLGIEGK